MSNLIPGGLAAGMKPADFDREALKRGTFVELEHTDSWNVAQEIAMDHLVEDPDYYEKLATIEGHMQRNPTYRTSYDKGHSHTVTVPEYLQNVDWEKVGKRAVMPLSALGDDSDYEENPIGSEIWALMSIAGTAAGSYHGYKRNENGEHPFAWALWWGLWGAVLPPVTVAIAWAQGFAEPEQNNV